MNRILSWKIDAGVYAYIYLPNSLTHISSRITEDSPLWSDILNEVSTWDEPAYRSHFDEMVDEIKQRYGVILTYQADFFNFVDENAVNGTNIVILAGEDGTGGNSNGIFGGGTGDASAVYDEILAAVSAKLAAERAEILAENNAVRDFLEDYITNTISEAQKTIDETKEELKATSEEMTGRLDDATDALNKAAELFEMGDGNIDGEAIKEAFNSLDEIEEWMDTYSGSMIDMKTDYDAANQMMGQIGTGEDVTKGCFSKMASAMNVLSGTVGTVRSDLNAANGTISNIASWYDQYASAATEAAQFISASAATIENNVKYVTEGGINSQITSTIDGMKGEIKDAVLSETQAGITSVQQTLNSFSASISTEIAHLAPDSALTSMGERMDALNVRMSEWMTITDSAMSMTMDLREDWSVESGKMSTVSSMIAETNADGTPIYYVSAETGVEIVVTKTETGEFVDTDGNVYPSHRGYVHYGEMLASYIRQTASSMTLSVMNEDNMTAAIKLAIVDSGDGPEGIITMVAEEVVIDADIIAKAISAKSANIGGVILDYGSIYCMATTPDPLGEYYYSTTYVSSSFTHDESGNVLSSYTYNVTLLDGKPEDFSTTAATTEDNILRTDFTSYTTDKYPLKYLKGYYYEPLFKLDGLNGVLYAGDARIRGSISADTGYIGGSIISGGSIQSSLLAEDGTPLFKLDGNTGFFLASNADVRGRVTVDDGRIGGFNIKDNMLEVLDSETEKPVGFLNGGDTYADDEEGKLIIAAGIEANPDDEVTLYKWTCGTAPEYNELYTRILYSAEEGTQDGESVQVFTYNANTKEYQPLNIYVTYVRRIVQTETDDVDEQNLEKALGSIVYTDASGGTTEIPTMEYLSYKEYEDGVENEYLYINSNETVQGTGVLEANTRLYGSGYLNTSSLYARDGFFGGSIESNGTFRGRLADAYGSLNNININATLIQGNINMAPSNSLKAKNSASTYFDVVADNMSKTNALSYYKISTYKIESQNRDNNDYTWESTITVANFNFEAGGEISIPETWPSINYWLPNHRSIYGPQFTLRLLRTYEGESQSTIYNKNITFNGYNWKGYMNYSSSFPAETFQCEKKGTAILTLSYYIHLPRRNGGSYPWMGFYYGGGNIKITYPDLIAGTVIASNGMRSITPRGATISVIDDEVLLLSPNQNNGLRISDSGISYKKNGGDWTSL